MLLDEEGPDALTMRSLAARLDSKPMSLYTHIASKDDVLDGVNELILSSLDLPPVEGVPWRQWCHDAWSEYRRVLLNHPRAAVAILRWQGPRGTEMPRVSDLAIGALRGGGLSIEDAVLAYRALTAFTLGMVQIEAAARDRPPVEPVAPLGLAHWDAALPHIADPDFDTTFRTGLDAMIAGLSAIARAGSTIDRSCAPRRGPWL